MIQPTSFPNFSRAMMIIAIVIAGFFLTETSEARVQRSCSNVFGAGTMTGSEALVKLDDLLRGRLLNGRTLESLQPEMGLLRKWKLRSLKKRLELSKLSRSHGLNGHFDIIADLHLIFIEPRLQSLDIFRFLSRRNEDKLFKAWVERQLIGHGLQRLVSDARITNPVYKIGVLRALQKVKTKLSKLKRLPFLDREIPHDVLYRVLENGIESERPALEALYGNQSRVEVARALKPYLSLVGFVLLGYGAEIAQTKIETNRAEQAGEKLVSEMQSTEQGLDELIAELQAQKNAAKLKQ